MASKALLAAIAPFERMAAKQYQKLLTPTLNSFGLRYEDLLNENTSSVSEALALADKDTITARTRRAKRAIDLSFKKKDLTKYAPDMKLEPYKTEILDDVEAIQERDTEFFKLNAYLS